MKSKRFKKLTEKTSGLNKYDEKILETGKRFKTATELIESFLNNKL